MAVNLSVNHAYRRGVQTETTSATASPTLRARILETKITTGVILHAEIWLLLVVNYLSNVGMLPSALTYAFDVFNVCLLLLNLKRLGGATKGIAFFNVLLIVLAVYAFITTAVHSVAPQYIAWELLSFGRLFVWIYLFLIFWTKEDVHRVLRALYRIQWVNLAFVGFQYYVLNLVQDNVGGIFGTVAGCNGPLNVYLIIVCAWAVNRYLARATVGLGGLAATLVASCAVASVAELKVFYVECVVILVIGLLCNRFSFKTVLTIIAVFAAAYVGLQVLAVLFPSSYETLTDLTAFFEEADNSDRSTGYGVSRLHAFSQLSSMFLDDDSIDSLLGMGLGSASMSSISFFCSPFYNIYGPSLNYHFLTSAYLILQLGYIGVVLYFAIPVILALAILKNYRAVQAQLSGAAGFGVCMCAVFIINVMYNNTLHTYLSVFWALVLFVGLVCIREAQKAGVASNERKE